MSMPQPVTRPALLLRERRWYGWQAIGSGGLPAPWRASPMFIETVTPLKTGQGLLRVDAVVLLRPFVPRRVEVCLKVRWRTGDVIIVDWQAPGEPPCLAAISEIDLDWIRQHCAAAVDQQDVHLPAMAGYGPVGAPAQAWLSRKYGATPEAMLAGAAAFRTLWPSWPKPLPRTGTVKLDWRCQDMAAYRLLRGSVPEDPEDKWYIYLDGDHLMFQRAATGITVWRVQISVTEEEVVIRNLTVLLDRRHYGFGKPADELARFDFIVRSLLMGQDVAPAGYADINPRQAAAAWRQHERQEIGKEAWQGGRS